MVLEMLNQLSDGPYGIRRFEDPEPKIGPTQGSRFSRTNQKSDR